MRKEELIAMYKEEATTSSGLEGFIALAIYQQLINEDSPLSKSIPEPEELNYNLDLIPEGEIKAYVNSKYEIGEIYTPRDAIDYIQCECDPEDIVRIDWY